MAAGRLPSTGYPSLEALLATFVAQQQVQGVTHASLAVAGPVANGRATITNLGWEPTERGVAQALGLRHVRLLNDLEAIANAIPELLPEDSQVLVAGTAEPDGAIAVVAPGTGLGEAFLVCRDGRVSAYPSEGGHCDFGPVDDEQVALWHWCERRFGHVSYERVCSGIGLPNLYDFLCESGRARSSEAVVAALAGARGPHAGDLRGGAAPGSGPGVCRRGLAVRAHPRPGERQPRAARARRRAACSSRGASRGACARCSIRPRSRRPSSARGGSAS